MKRILIISALLFAGLSLFAQYPNNARKQRLGFQTTGAGLVYIQSGAPAHTPSTDENTWMVLDTTNNVLYYWDETAGAWENLLDDVVRDTVFQITSVPDTSLLVPLQGDAFINSTADTLGLYSGSGWVLFYGTDTDDQTLSGNVSTKEITIEGGNTINLDDWFLDIVTTDGTLAGDGSVVTPLGVDTTDIATLYALQDTAVNIRAEIPEPDGNGIISALPDGSVAINGSANDLTIQTTGTVVIGDGYGDGNDTFFFLSDNNGSIGLESATGNASIRGEFINIESGGLIDIVYTGFGTSYRLIGIDSLGTLGNPLVIGDGFNIAAGAGVDTISVAVPGPDSTVATLYALQDTAAAIRADFQAVGVTDGDKGDIDVTSSGAVWTIDTNAVTVSKILDDVLSSVNFVVNDGGNIDLASEGDITVTPVQDSLKIFLDLADGAVDWAELSTAVQDSIQAGGSGISGLTTNYIPKATSATTIGNSVIYESGGDLGFGTTTMNDDFNFQGDVAISSNLYVGTNDVSFPFTGDLNVAGSSSVVIELGSHTSSWWLWGVQPISGTSGANLDINWYNRQKESRALAIDGDNNFMSVGNHPNGGFPAYSLHVFGTDGIKIPNGTTAQRPTGANGVIRYNTTTSAFEGYSNSTYRAFYQESTADPTSILGKVIGGLAGEITPVAPLSLSSGELSISQRYANMRKASGEVYAFSTTPELIDTLDGSTAGGLFTNGGNGVLTYGSSKNRVFQVAWSVTFSCDTAEKEVTFEIYEAGAASTYNKATQYAAAADKRYSLSGIYNHTANNTDTFDIRGYIDSGTANVTIHNISIVFTEM